VSGGPAGAVELGRTALPTIGPAALTMGVFDGVHRGHQALLRATVAAAGERGLRSVALVFDPHPDEVLRPGTHVPRLAPLAVNRQRIESDIGLDTAVALRFDPALRALTAEEFLERLRPAIELGAIVMSPESAFGRGRGGTVARLREIGAEDGFEVITVDPVEADGEVISSARIRRVLEAGEIEQAAALGYAPALVGVLGPDGTLRFDYLPALPASGTYLATMHAPGEAHHGVGARLRVDATDARVAAEIDPAPAAPAPPGRLLEFRLPDRA
jgi:FAD synthase